MQATYTLNQIKKIVIITLLLGVAIGFCINKFSMQNKLIEQIITTQIKNDELAAARKAKSEEMSKGFEGIIIGNGRKH